MVKPMRYREIEAALLRNGCRWTDSKGDHVKWYCPCGRHSVPVDTARTISPGVVRDIIKKLACLPEGWLQ
ncbi:MAG: type II toxin-antitoxin system HicA family toxin [Jatrophihabitans sp.]|nr:MAG: type II toxin-antitoxin system HicA family toxin [Jatrophihabitans sp.]